MLGTIGSGWQAFRATQAEQHAQSELEQKQQQYERAEANYLKTLEAVDQLLTEVGEKELASMPHLEHVRRRLLDKALKFFEEFLQAKGTDPTVRFEAALAYRRVGVIRQLLSEYQQAEQAYGQAIDLLNQFQAEAPAKRVYRQELARAYHGRAVALDDLGRREAAAKANETAVKLQETLVAEDPAHPEYRYDLANTHNARGMNLRTAGLFPEAERAARQGEQIMEELVARYPDKAEYHKALAGCQLQLAWTLRDAGKMEEAEKAHHRMAATVARAMKPFPRDQRVRQLELAVFLNYGRFLWETGRIPEATKSMQSSLPVAQKLVDDFPGIPWYRENLAGAHGNLGALFMDHDGPNKAEKHLSHARGVFEKLAADYPTVPAYQSHHGGALSNLAMALERLGKPEQARPLLERAITCQREALRLNPGHRGFRQFLCAHVHNLANVLAQLSVPPEELDKTHQQSIELARALATDYPDVSEYQEDAGNALKSWAGVVMKRQQGEQVRLLLEEAIGYQDRALRSDPKRPKYRQAVAASRNQLGLLLADLKRPKEAEKAYRAAVDLDRELVDEFPSVTKHATRLGGVSCNLGNLMFQGGRHDDALVWYGQAIGKLAPIVQKEKEGQTLVLARRFLLNSYRGRALVFDQLRRHDEAAADWAGAVTLSSEQEKPNYQMQLMRSRICAKQFAPALQVAEKLAGSDSGQVVFTCALAYAVAHDATKLEKHAARAVELLRQAVAKDYRAVTAMKQERALDILRGRQDFRQLLAEVDKQKSANSPPSK